MFIWADTAVTRSNTHEGQSLKATPFGEAPWSDPDFNVQAGALKIERCGDSLFAMAGDASTAYAILKSFRSALSLGLPNLESMKSAIASNGPYSPDLAVELLWAFPGDRGPRMFGFVSPEDDLRELVAGDLAQFGSAPHNIKELTAKSIFRLLAEDMRLPTDDFAVMALASLQRNGPANYLMSNGVGGAYVAAYLDSNGIHWQKDVLFCIYSAQEVPFQVKHMATTFVRDDVLVALPAPSRAQVFFPDGKSAEGWARAHHPMNVRRIRAGHVDYIAWLDVSSVRVVVARVNQALLTQDLEITVTPDPANMQTLMNIRCGPHISSRVLRPLPLKDLENSEPMFSFVSFKEVSERKSSDTPES